MNLYFKTNSSGNISYNIYGNLSCNLQTSTDQITWIDWDGAVIQLSSNPLYVRNTSTSLSNRLGWLQFSTDENGSTLVGGDIMSLISPQQGETPTNCFRSLFKDCKSLDNTGDLTLSSNILWPWCCHEMFAGCTSLTTAPTISATEVKDYACNLMFANCTSLISCPSLSAMSLGKYCYQNMFKGCSSLTSVSNLPATTASEGCYRGMFIDCISLKDLAHMSLSSLDNYSCEGMYIACENLKINTQGIGEEGPVINYSTETCRPTTDMLLGTGEPDTSTPKSNVTLSYPDDCLYFVATQEGSKISYENHGSVACNLQTSIDKINWTDWNTEISLVVNEKLYVRNTVSIFSSSDYKYVNFWITGSVNAGGNILSLLNYSSISKQCFAYLFQNYAQGLKDVSKLIFPDTTAQYCYYSMFGNSGITQAPKILPSTNLTYGCYQNMFQMCRALKTAPIISATTLNSRSCESMFQYCSNLKVSEGNGSKAFFTCPDTASLRDPVANMFYQTAGSFKSTPVAGNNYYYN